MYSNFSKFQITLKHAIKKITTKIIWTKTTTYELVSLTNLFLDNLIDPYLRPQMSEKKYLHHKVYFCVFLDSKCHCSALKRKVQKADLTFEVNWNRASDFCGKILGCTIVQTAAQTYFCRSKHPVFLSSAPRLKCTFNILGFLD